jgi:hypothetical protein
MPAGQRPGTVIVCTPDCTHPDYIVRAPDAGCDVITEKLLATTAAGLAAIRSNSYLRGFCMRLSCGHFGELIDIGLLCGKQGGDYSPSVVGEMSAVGDNPIQTNSPRRTPRIRSQKHFSVFSMPSVVN